MSFNFTLQCTSIDYFHNYFVFFITFFKNFFVFVCLHFQNFSAREKWARAFKLKRAKCERAKISTKINKHSQFHVKNHVLWKNFKDISEKCVENSDLTKKKWYSKVWHFFSLFSILTSHSRKLKFSFDFPRRIVSR